MRQQRITVLLALSAMLVSQAAPSAADTVPTFALHGRIATSLRYRLRIDYATTAAEPSCQFDDYITGLSIAQTTSLYGAPEIRDGRHSLTMPLSYPGHADSCGWQATTIYLCVGAATAPDPALSCQPWFVMRPAAETAPAAVTLACDAAGVCTDRAGRAPVLQVERIDRPIALDLGAAPVRTTPSP